jgi:hypothetical protein
LSGTPTFSSTGPETFQVTVIPLLNSESLLRELKKLVTTEPTESIKVPTGIPPHINNAILIKKILDLCINTLEEVKQLAESVKNAVRSKRRESDGKWPNSYGANEVDFRQPYIG